MQWALAVPFCLGVCAVLQGGLNRQISQGWGLASAVFLNNLVFMAAGTTLFLVAKFYPHLLPSAFRGKGTLSQFSWWYLLPGLLGFSLVAGIPWAIGKMGALKVFIAIIGAQMIASIAWDFYAQDIRPSSTRIACAVVSFISAAVLALRG